MSMIRTSNPAFSGNPFSGVVADETGMTLRGTVNRTSILFVLLLVAAGWSWNVTRTNPDGALPWIFGGAIGGLVLAIVTIFKKPWSPVTAPLYAIAEGFVLGGVSAFYEAQFHGIVLQAMGLTLGTFAALLMAYATGMIRASEGFKAGVLAATGGICLVYLASMVMNLCGMQMPYLHSAGPIGIGISLFVVVIAALNLVLDFDFIEQGVARGAPKYMEWYGGFGLLVTLVWLYLEILRLLSKLNRR